MRQLLVFFALPVLLLVAGCNDDVFLDEPNMPDILNDTIEGDGGEATFTIPTRGLERVSLNVMSESERYCTYYNAAGGIIDHKSPASEVSRIVFESDLSKFELRRQGKTLTVKSFCSMFDMEACWSIRLDYSYGVRFIDIAVLPGKPVKLLEVIYHPDGLKIEDRAKVNTQRFEFYNTSPLPQTFEVRPYLGETASILVLPEGYNSWVRGERLNIKVPVFDNGSWQLKEKQGIMPGTNFTYERPDCMMAVNVDVPAYSNVNIFTDVIYSQAQASGYMIFLNEVLNRKVTLGFTVTSLYPTAYKIRTENAK